MHTAKVYILYILKIYIYLYELTYVLLCIYYAF